VEEARLAAVTVGAIADSRRTSASRSPPAAARTSGASGSVATPLSGSGVRLVVIVRGTCGEMSHASASRLAAALVRGAGADRSPERKKKKSRLRVIERPESPH
jgi:hypothetical protein